MRQRPMSYIAMSIVGLGWACQPDSATVARPEAVSGTAEAKAIGSANPKDGGAATSDAPSGEETPLPIEARYTGRVNVPSAGPGAPPAKMPPRVIRDRHAFEALLAMIPKKKIQQKQPAPPSDDPLLAETIDFDASMLVVVFRTDTMYVPPELSNPRERGDKVHVDMRMPPLGDTAMAAAPYGVGSYAALRLPRRDAHVELID